MTTQAELNRVLLLLGPPGVGKSTILRRLSALDRRFDYVRPFITRPLRYGETDKIQTTEAHIREMEAAGELLVVNFLFGVYYGTPRKPIDEALRDGRFPMIDWPITELSVMTNSYGGRVLAVYIVPPSLDVLRSRLLQRDGHEHRFQKASEEYHRFAAGEFDGQFGMSVVSDENAIDRVAELILAKATSA